MTDDGICRCSHCRSLAAQIAELKRRLAAEPDRELYAEMRDKLEAYERALKLPPRRTK